MEFKSRWNALTDELGAFLLCICFICFTGPTTVLAIDCKLPLDPLAAKGKLLVQIDEALKNVLKWERTPSPNFQTSSQILSTLRKAAVLNKNIWVWTWANQGQIQLPKEHSGKLVEVVSTPSLHPFNGEQLGVEIKILAKDAEGHDLTWYLNANSMIVDLAENASQRKAKFYAEKWVSLEPQLEALQTQWLNSPGGSHLQLVMKAYLEKSSLKISETGRVRKGTVLGLILNVDRNNPTVTVSLSDGSFFTLNQNDTIYLSGLKIE